MKRLLAFVPLVFAMGCAKTVLMGAATGRGAPFPARPAGASYPNWEYVCGGVGTREGVTNLLNAAGAEGWELVSFDGSGFACFKRPVVAATASAP